MRRIHSDGNGEGGWAALLQWDGGRGPSHPQRLFSISSQSWLEAVTLESWEQVPVLPFGPHFLKSCLGRASPAPVMFCSPRRPGEGAERVYAAQRGQSWEGPGQRPLPWGDRGEMEPQPLWAHRSAWEIQDDKSAEETGMGREGGARGTASSGCVVHRTGSWGSRCPQVGVRATYGKDDRQPKTYHQ